MNKDEINSKPELDSNYENTGYNLDSSVKKRERDSESYEEENRQLKKQRNESEINLEPAKEENGLTSPTNQISNNFTNTNTNINNNFNIIIQPSIPTFPNQTGTGNYTLYNTHSQLNAGQNNIPKFHNSQNVYLQQTPTTFPYQGTSTYNLYQTLSQYNNLGINATLNNYNYYPGSTYNQNYSTYNYLNSIPQSKINIEPYLASPYLINKLYTSKYGINQPTLANLKSDNIQGVNQEQNKITDNTTGPGYDFIKNHSGSIQANSNLTNAEKQKYVIKDMPELTVANYFQNKNVQSKYLSSIQKKEDENPTNTNTSNENPVTINNEEDKETDPVKINSELTVEEKNSTKEASSSISINTNINQTTNTLNYNLNINNPKRDEEHAINTTSNNIILNTKSAPAQINSVSMNKSINQTKLGNVITFNKAPSGTIINTATSSHPTVMSSGTSSNDNVTKIQPKEKPQSKSGDFSESLQKYIQLAFEKCKDDEDRRNCQKALTKIISASLEKGDFNTRDWTKHPLPVLPSDVKEEIITRLQKTPVSDLEIKKRETRKGRFDAEYKLKKSTLTSNSNTSALSNTHNSTAKVIEEITKNVKIIGTCQSLEKPYLRLTTLPDPSQVRPQNILVKTLKMLKDKWKKKESDYNYVSEQFRSIRQDMTIQHIQNEFTVKVYETHARIALESYDLDQFNQCQTCLISLYEEGLQGNKIEFMAYRIIYTTLQGIKCDMDNLLKDIYSQEKKQGLITKNFEISHALKVMKSINTANYFEFFKLYKITPNMGCYLIQPFLPRLRLKALQIIAVGYYTEVSISFISDKIAFESEEKCIEFLNENNIKLSKDNKNILCKDSLSAINNSHLLAMLQLKVGSSN